MFGPGSGPIVLSNADCNGSYYHIFQCSSPVIPDSCSHNDDAGVICIPALG